MACSGCRRKKKQVPIDSRGNPVESRGTPLDKYAYLNPNQLALRDAQRAAEKEVDKDKEG